MLKYGKNNPIVYSDSAYCVNTYNTWMFGWANAGWVKSDGQTPENLDLINAYYTLYQQGHRINLIKVKGHNGIQGNELADKLATGVISSDEIMKKFGGVKI
jgi:ribonuclease HI